MDSKKVHTATLAASCRIKFIFDDSRRDGMRLQFEVYVLPSGHLLPPLCFVTIYSFRSFFVLHYFSDEKTGQVPAKYCFKAKSHNYRNDTAQELLKAKFQRLLPWESAKVMRLQEFLYPQTVIHDASMNKLP